MDDGPADEATRATALLLAQGKAEQLFDEVRRRGLLLPSGRLGHWILEVHLVDRDRAIGGFYEQLLTV